MTTTGEWSETPAVRKVACEPENIFSHSVLTLVGLGIMQEMKCVFCGLGVENFDHLFFLCPFSERIWLMLWDRCNLPGISGILLDLIQAMASPFKGQSVFSLVAKLMLAAAVYAIWHFFHARMYQGKIRDFPLVVNEIMYWVRAKIHSSSLFTSQGIRLCMLSSLRSISKR